MTRGIADPTAPDTATPDTATPDTATRPVLRRLAEVLAAQAERTTAPAGSGIAAEPAAAPAGRATQAESGLDATGSTAGPVTGATGAESASLRRIDPVAPAMADRVLRAATEIMCGRRAAEQLATVLRPDQLSYLIGLRSAARQLRPHIQSVHSQQPAPGVLEATGVVVLRTGVRALSARFEVHVMTGGVGWQCTALHLPLTRGDITAAQRLR